MKTNGRFRHESLQDQETIADLLKALTTGIAKGKIVLEDENGAITMEPSGLLHLKVSGTQDEERNRLNIRISWQEEQDIPKKKNIKITSK